MSSTFLDLCTSISNLNFNFSLNFSMALAVTIATLSAPLTSSTKRLNAKKERCLLRLKLSHQDVHLLLSREASTGFSSFLLSSSILSSIDSVVSIYLAIFMFIRPGIIVGIVVGSMLIFPIKGIFCFALPVNNICLVEVKTLHQLEISTLQVSDHVQ